MRIVVMDTWEGPRLVARGRCGCCGFHDWGEFDVGLVDRGDGEWDFDADASPACPACGVHEISFPDGFGVPAADIQRFTGSGS